MKNLGISIMYVSFFGLIAFVCYYTESASPLWALLLTPQYVLKSIKKKTK